MSCGPEFTSWQRECILFLMSICMGRQITFRNCFTDLLPKATIWGIGSTQCLCHPGLLSESVLTRKDILCKDVSGPQN